MLEESNRRNSYNVHILVHRRIENDEKKTNVVNERRRRFAFERIFHFQLVFGTWKLRKRSARGKVEGDVETLTRPSLVLYTRQSRLQAACYDLRRYADAICIRWKKNSWTLNSHSEKVVRNSWKMKRFEISYLLKWRFETWGLEAVAGL